MRNPNTVRAYNFLREKILSGCFEPGQFLSAQSLSKEVGVSRTPVREALRQLENDELVTIVPKLGAVVRTLDEEQFENLLGYREALEVQSAGEAAQLRRSEEIERMLAILNAMRDQVNTLSDTVEDMDGLTELSEQDIRFHAAIFAAARNKFIKERLERTHILQRMVTPSLVRKRVTQPRILRASAQSVFEEHLAIFEAIRDGDVERARKAMRDHLRNFAAKISRHSIVLPEVLPRNLVEATI